MPLDLGTYATARPMFGSLPSWVTDPEEQARLAAYNLYEAIYWTVPDTFKLVSRGAEDKPIYLPSGRTIVETLHRFMAVKPKPVVDPAFGSSTEQALALQVITDLFKRERFLSRFNANKRYGIMRGDWMWHIYADPAAAEGSKISIFPLDPSSAFPIYEEDNIDNIIGWHIVEQYVNQNGEARIKRLTYRKVTGTGGPSPISREEGVFKVDDWGGPGMENQEPIPEEQTMPLETLPSPIDQLPVYLIPNFDEPGQIWGSSEMRGLERLMGAQNQSISDEDLALALEGIGVYATDAGTPVNDDGEDVPWNLGPGRVVELPDGKKMVRVNGVSSIVPYQEHIKFLQGAAEQAVGVSDIAKGRVNVEVAESGVALMLELAPLLARVSEKEQTVIDVHSNILFDLPKWYIGYEGTMFNGLLNTRIDLAFGDPLPRNRKQELQDLLAMYGATPMPIVSAKYVRQRARQMGFDDMPDDLTMLSEILSEQQAGADVMGARLDKEVSNELGEDPDPDEEEPEA